MGNNKHDAAMPPEFHTKSAGHSGLRPMILLSSKPDGQPVDTSVDAEGRIEITLHLTAFPLSTSCLATSSSQCSL